MPKEYIERETVDAAIKAAADHRKTIGVPGEQAGFLQAHDIVRSFPAADVVEVVRCRDCEFSLLWHKNLYCQKLRDYWNRDRDRMVEDTDFCAWGLRKEGGQDE